MEKSGSFAVIHDLSHGGEPGEVKHLSTPRKRNQNRYSLSSGERTGNSPKVIYVQVEASWEGAGYRVILPYT